LVKVFKGSTGAFDRICFFKR